MQVNRMNNNFNCREYNASTKDLKETYLSSVLDIEDDENLSELVPELLGIDSLVYETKVYYDN